MKFQVIGFILGILIASIGLAELIPALVDFSNNHAQAHVFFFNALICLFFGGALTIAGRAAPTKILDVRTAFLLITTSGIVLSFFAALPLYMAGLGLDFADAYFEAMSGFTTTGSTVLSNLDVLPRGILVWRSLIQWMGGAGIVALGMILLPFLRVGGMQFFQTESSDTSPDKIMPRTRSLLRSIFLVYGLLTLACGLTYYALGMSGFDAINHAMTTVSTAGFSTHDRSFAYFSSPAIPYAAAFFMFMGALPLGLFIKLALQGRMTFWRDEQVRIFTLLTMLLTIVLTFWLWHNTLYSFERNFRFALFNIVSVISTTGYSSTDYLQWGSFATMAFLLATYIGGCAGSTAGGPKTMRLIIAAKIVNRHFKSLIYPRGAFPLAYQGRPLNHAMILSTLGFLSFYVLANVMLTLAVSMTGVDFLTALSGVAAALSNTRSGIGDIIGPTGNYAPLPDTAKWILCLAMLLGRLEILTVIVLFLRAYWRE